MKKNNCKICKIIPFFPLSGETVLLRKVSVKRNFLAHKFCGAGRFKGMDAKIMSKLKTYFKSAHKMHFFDADFSQEEKKLLKEAFLLGDFFDGKSPGAVFTGKDFLAVANFFEHLELISCFGQEESFRQVYEKISSAEISLGEIFDYAYSNDFGFLSVNPLSSGAMTEYSALIHIPALSYSDAFNAIKKEALALNISISSLSQDFLKTGDFYIVSHNSGQDSQMKALNKFELFLENLKRKELLARSEILSFKDKNMEDIIYRCAGTLKNARRLGYFEAVNCLSFVKLGIDLGYRMFSQTPDISKAFYFFHKSFMDFFINKLEEGEEDFLRADISREIFI